MVLCLHLMRITNATSFEINYNDLSARGADNSCSVCTLRCRHYVHLSHSNLFHKEYCLGAGTGFFS